MSTPERQSYLSIANDGFSPLVFDGLPYDRVATDNAVGRDFTDDFQTFSFGGDVAIGTAHTAYPCSFGTVFIDYDAESVALTNELNGCLAITGSTTENDEIYLVGGSNTAAQVVVSSTAPKDWAFEARVKIAAITADIGGFFFGLGTVGLAAADTLTDTTQLLKTAADFVGFQCLPAAPQTVKGIYKESGVADASKGVVVATAATLVAGTYVKLGLRYNAVSDKLLYYVDNALVGTLSGVRSNTAFPIDVPLAALIAQKVGGASAAPVATVDWIKVFQAK